ncbi:hypothetical protein GIY30_23425 [Gordonia sp. HNM0687]|uniref:Tox-REase-9 domain-containing protein n=1 Tax=Gordonia mangrovi TaxID=2665643 RepID=A0A6L7GZ88_9ACTN|nr:hypothetical protein [Gordonia mangrovi]MXP24278.1 hypothetical protein [Gordonia mangrovi]UVF79903.1 hypothetical protein NWF22_08815 [Gordonia mangrovi]
MALDGNLGTEDSDGDGIVENQTCAAPGLCPREINPPRIGGLPLPRPVVPPRVAPKSPAPRTSERAPSNEQPKADDRRDRGDGRDSLGRYAKGNDGRSGKDEEKRILDELEKDQKVPIIRDQRQATIPGGKHGRFYDGLMPNGDGTYTGIEVKSGGASKTRQQKEFDARVSPETPASVRLPDGTTVKITGVWDEP